MNVLLAGGGTGGHLFPGIAIAQEFRARSPENKVAFVGSPRGIEARVLPELNLTLMTIQVRGFKGMGLFGKLESLVSVPAACLQSAAYIRRFRADIVVGLGGYISFPAVVAAKALGLPAVIHEQNSVSGLSNRLLGKMANRIFVSYQESMEYFPRHKTVFSGMPVRTAFLNAGEARAETPFCVFILGGSQGAREINRAVLEALPSLAVIKERLCFIHQSGGRDAEEVETGYRSLGFRAQVLPFIDDIGACYRRAHLVISRAGAATLAELAACGRAAVLVPYPHAAHNHQEKNARVFAESGAAVMIRSGELSGGRLADMVKEFEQRPAPLRQMEQRAAALARAAAAKTIVDECCRMVA